VPCRAARQARGGSSPAYSRSVCCSRCPLWICLQPFLRSCSAIHDAPACSCIAGMLAIHGNHRQLLLRCRHTCHPWQLPATAPALPAYLPSMAITGNCSCVAGILAIHGNKKTRRVGRVWVEKHDCATYPAELKSIGRRAREVMPAAMRALVRISALAGCWVIWASTLPVFLPRRNKPRSGSDLAIYSAGLTLTRTRMRSPGS